MPVVICAVDDEPILPDSLSRAMTEALAAADASDAILRGRNSFAVDPEKLDCDAAAGNEKDAIREK